MRENPNAIIVLVVALVVVVLGVWAYSRAQRRRALVRKYGPEYDRLVRYKGDPRRAEKELEEREKRVSSFHLRHLTPQQRERYLDEWNRIQRAFVDEPARAASRFVGLVTGVFLLPMLVGVRGRPSEKEMRRDLEDVVRGFLATLHPKGGTRNGPRS